MPWAALTWASTFQLDKITLLQHMYLFKSSLDISNKYLLTFHFRYTYKCFLCLPIIYFNQPTVTGRLRHCVKAADINILWKS